MRRGASANGSFAPPSYEQRPQFKALAKKFTSINKNTLTKDGDSEKEKKNNNSESVENIQQQLQAASLQLEAASANRGSAKAATGREAVPSSEVAEPQTSIQLFIDAASKQCGGTLKALMYAKPSAVNHDVASRNSKTEPHDLQLATSHSPQLATADGAQESAATVLLAAMNSEEIIGKIHSAFLAPDGSKLKLDVNMFVKCIVNLLLNGPGKERFAAGSAAKDTLLPLLCDIFAAVDSENRGSVTWEELSTYLLQGAMQHSSDVKLSRVFATRAMEEIALLFKRPGGTLWLNERHLLATWDKGGNVLHLIDWERMIEVTRLPNAATIVTAICISKNRLAVSLFNHTVVIWNTASFDGMSIEYMMLHSSSQVSLLWQGGLSRLLCGGSDGTITCWSCSSSPVKLFANQIHGDSVRIMTNITGMDSFATSGNDGKVLLLDQVTHKVRRSYKGHASTVHSICWEPTLKLIVTASISSEIVGYSPYSDRELFRLVKHLVAVSGLFVMADAPILLSWDVGGSICVWDLATTDFHHMLFLPHDLRGCVQCVVPVMRRHVLYFVGPRYVMPLDFSISSFPHLADDEPIIGAHYSDAYSMIATATSRTIRLWNAKNGRMLRTFEPPVASHIVSLSTDPSGKKLFLCTSAGVAYRLDFASGIITHEYTPHGVTTEQHVVSAAGIQEVKHSYERREVAAAVYVPEDCALVTCGWDAKIILHDDINDCAQGKTSLRLMEAHRKDLNCVAVSWPCRLIAAAGVEGFISCWDYEQPGGKMFDFCMGHTMDTTALAFLDPYPLLSSCDSSGNIAIWIVPPFHPSSMQYLCVSRATLRCGATALVWINSTKSLFAADEEGAIYSFDLHGLLAAAPFHPLPQRPPTNAGELRVRKHGVTPRMPAKYPRDASWPTDLPKWLARVPPPHCADFFSKFPPLVPAFEWRAHMLTVQSLSTCFTVASEHPALLSTGDDGHVRLWNLNGTCLGSLAQVNAFADVPWTFDPQLQLKHLRRAATMKSVSSFVAPLFEPAAVSVKLNLRNIKPSNTFLTQMPQSVRSHLGGARRKSTSGFLTERRALRAPEGASQSQAASEIVAKAFASAGRRGSVTGRT